MIVFVQVLQDGRLVDLPLSDPFLRLMCGEELTAEHLEEIDPIRHRYVHCHDTIIYKFVGFSCRL